MSNTAKNERHVSDAEALEAWQIEVQIDAAYANGQQELIDIFLLTPKTTCSYWRSIVLWHVAPHDYSKTFTRGRSMDASLNITALTEEPEITALLEDLEEEVGLPVQGTHVGGPPCGIIIGVIWAFTAS